MKSLFYQSKEQLAMMPKEILLKYEDDIKLVFDKLPEEMKSDPDIAIHQACTEHFNGGDDSDVIDGPPPSKKKCIECLAVALKSL